MGNGLVVKGGLGKGGVNANNNNANNKDGGVSLNSFFNLQPQPLTPVRVQNSASGKHIRVGNMSSSEKEKEKERERGQDAIAPAAASRTGMGGSLSLSSTGSLLLASDQNNTTPTRARKKSVSFSKDAVAGLGLEQALSSMTEATDIANTASTANTSSTANRIPKKTQTTGQNGPGSSKHKSTNSKSNANPNLGKAKNGPKGGNTKLLSRLPQTFFLVELVDPQINFLDTKNHCSVICVSGRSTLEGKRAAHGVQPLNSVCQYEVYHQLEQAGTGGGGDVREQELPLRKPKRRLELYLRMDKVSAFTTKTVDDSDSDEESSEKEEGFSSEKGNTNNRKSDGEVPEQQQEDRVCWKRLDYTFQSNADNSRNTGGNGVGEDSGSQQRDSSSSSASGMNYNATGRSNRARASTHSRVYGESLRELADVEEEIVAFSNDALMTLFRSSGSYNTTNNNNRERDSDDDSDFDERERQRKSQTQTGARVDNHNYNPALERTIRRAITDFDVKANYRYWTEVSQEDWKTLFVKTQKAGEAVSMTSDFSLDLQKFEMVSLRLYIRVFFSTLLASYLTWNAALDIRHRQLWCSFLTSCKNTSIVYNCHTEIYSQTCKHIYTYLQDIESHQFFIIADVTRNVLLEPPPKLKKTKIAAAAAAAAAERADPHAAEEGSDDILSIPFNQEVLMRESITITAAELRSLKELTTDAKKAVKALVEHYGQVLEEEEGIERDVRVTIGEGTWVIRTENDAETVTTSFTGVEALFKYVLILIMFIDLYHGYLSIYAMVIISPTELYNEEPMPVFFYRILQYH